MTKQELNKKLWEAAKIGDYIDTRDEVFQVVEEDKYNVKRTFYFMDELLDYLNTRKKIVKGIKCIDGLINVEGNRITCNLFKIKVIEEGYTYDELLELGYSFKEINKILKQQEER